MAIIMKEKELKLQQTKLLKSQNEKNIALELSMKLKDEFLYLITHEFKTPLAVVSSALQTLNLVCNAEMPVKAKKLIETIKQNTNIWVNIRLFMKTVKLLVTLSHPFCR